MAPRVKEIPRDSPLYPAGLQSFFRRIPPRLWCTGEAGILQRRLLAVISSRRTEPGLALKAAKLMKQLARSEETFIGGWHSPLEQEALRFLLKGSPRIIFCPSKSLSRFTPPPEIQARVGRGCGLLLTHCSPRIKRMSRYASVRRNQLVVGAAKAVLALSAPERSASLRLAQSAIRQGKPVFTLCHPMNAALIAAGASPATRENIQRVLRG